MDTLTMSWRVVSLYVWLGGEGGSWGCWLDTYTCLEGFICGKDCVVVCAWHISSGIDETVPFFLAVIEVSNIRRRGMCRSMGYSGKLVYLVLVHVLLWFWHWRSVPWCDRPMLLPRAWFYCGGSIFHWWFSRFLWWVVWTILVPFFDSYVSEIRLLCTCKGCRN